MNQLASSETRHSTHAKGAEAAGANFTPRGAQPAATAIVPTYREADAIGDVVEGILTAADDVAARWEVLVVDDSPDRATVDAVPDHYDRVRAWHRQGDGLASAVLDGLRVSGGFYAIVLDGDGQHPPSVLPELYAQVRGGADVAVGGRHEHGATNRAAWGWRRYAMSLGASGLAWLAVPEARALQDPMSGCFAVRRSVVAPILDECDPEGHKILLELLARAPVRDVAEVPMGFGKRRAGESSTDGSAVAAYLRHLGRLAVAARRRPRPRRLGAGA
jgi:dolichol-phosphate mannosyltransferase